MKKIFVYIALTCFFSLIISPLIFAAAIGTTTTWNVPAYTAHSITYASGCSSTAFVFDENRAAIDGDIDGNGSKILPWSTRTTDSGGVACQSSSTAGMTITNIGNVTMDVDGNFSSLFYATGLDVNIWLKVWQGTGSGCGTSGMGGWNHRCDVIQFFDDVTPTRCRDYNSSNALLGAGLLINGLPTGDTNQLCFSGEFMAAVIGQKANVSGGDHNGAFLTTTYTDAGE